MGAAGQGDPLEAGQRRDALIQVALSEASDADRWPIAVPASCGPPFTWLSRGAFESFGERVISREGPPRASDGTPGRRERGLTHRWRMAVIRRAADEV